MLRAYKASTHSAGIDDVDRAVVAVVDSADEQVHFPAREEHLQCQLYAVGRGTVGGIDI